jgi:cob(I)alamin adenosyltransferase
MFNNISGLSDEEKQAMIEQRLKRFQRTHFDLILDLKAQEEIKSEEMYINATQEKIQALEKSFNALSRELSKIKKDNGNKKDKEIKKEGE